MAILIGRLEQSLKIEKAGRENDFISLGSIKDEFMHEKFKLKHYQHASLIMA
jgi:hypothetical protein